MDRDRSMEPTKVGIVGVTGYGGGELARLLSGHPSVQITYVTSSTYAGRPLHDALPGLRGTGLVCEVFHAVACADKCDVVFLAGEAGLAIQAAPRLLEQDKLVVDLSADFRLQSADEYAYWYGKPHTAVQWLGEAVYGLPELNRERIASARLCANPGCYPTSAILALAPLVSRRLVKLDTIIVDSMSGASGAGRSKFGLDFHFAEMNESARAYGVGGTHRHTPEIEQALAQVAGADVKITFTPHLVPLTRGILTTAYATLADSAESAQDTLALLHSLYTEYYQDAPFVVVLDAGQFPATKHVQGTNHCHIGLAVDARTNRVVVVSAIDNLGKGAAGQAIQNMNLMLGLPETLGLTGGAMWP